MALFKPSELSKTELEALDALEGIRRQVRYVVNSAPKRWLGLMSRNLLASAIQGSNSIEGYNATFDDAVAIVQHEETLNADEETRLALEGYRNAMTFVLQLAQDPAFSYQEGFIRSLHYMMLSHDLSKHPGNWRPGSVFVRKEETGEIVYEGPPREVVEPLMAELILSLNARTQVPVVVRAAMAHLNLVMVHPFSDGNGRMARCLQTLVLAREGILAPQFCSVEEYLGKERMAYYKVLGKVGKGSWHPDNDARPWIQFMIQAHLVQAHRVLWIGRQFDLLWTRATELAAEKKLPERAIQPIVDAMIGLPVRNSAYRKFAEISENLASRDLKALVDAGFLQPAGERRGRSYSGTKMLKQIWKDIIQPFVEPEPFKLDAKETQPYLPGLAAN